jgi:urease gamma subunit
LLLNHPEALALLTDEIFEEARSGRAWSEVVAHARGVLSQADVLPGVPELLRIIQVDAMFPDGTRLVTVHEPIGEGEP